MSRPLGVFVAPERPSWATFALLPDWEDFRTAAADSQRTGVKWVLGIYSPERLTPLAETFLPNIVRRMDEAGLRPHLVGVVYHEEWSGAFLSGQMPNPYFDHTNRAHWIPAMNAIKWWVGQQHAAIRAALPHVPVVWLDSFVNDDVSFGAGYYRPVPDGVDVLALYGYVPVGGSWAQDVEPFLDHAVDTRPESLVLVVQGFASANEPQWVAGPNADSIAGTKRWLAHPRVIAGWVFDWASRPSGITGLRDLPQRAALEHAMEAI